MDMGSHWLACTSFRVCKLSIWIWEAIFGQVTASELSILILDGIDEHLILSKIRTEHIDMGSHQWISDSF